MLVELPLQVLPEEDLLAPPFEKGARVGSFGAAEPLRPEAPRPVALAGCDQVGVERLEQGELLEGLPLPGEVILETLAPRAVAGAVPAAGEELSEEGAQHAQLEAVHLVVGDVGRRAQAGEQRGGAAELLLRRGAGAELRYRLELEIEVVDEAAAQGQVRTVGVRVAVAHRVQRVEPDETDAEGAHGPAGETPQVPEVADARVAPGTHAVEGDAQPAARAPPSASGASYARSGQTISAIARRSTTRSRRATTCRVWYPSGRGAGQRDFVAVPGALAVRAGPEVRDLAGG